MSTHLYSRSQYAGSYSFERGFEEDYTQVFKGAIDRIIPICYLV